MTAIGPLPPPPEVLPAAYAPFLAVLERLSDPLQQILRGQLIQFERVLRLSATERFASLGEFEGLGGLTQRGEIAHIVQSELLLRTHAPLEFLRRFAEAETLFHEKRYADPGARHVYRVMISIGPGILGHGRILALAALFYVARVAHQRGAAFYWTALPRDEGVVWFDELTVNSVKRFLRAASYREMTVEDAAAAAAAWTEASGKAASGDDLLDWVIAADQPRRKGRRDVAAVPAAAGAPNALTFALAAPESGQPRSIELRLRQNGWDRSRSTLVFPDDRVCASALNDPFRPFRPGPEGTQPAAAVPEQRGWEPEHLAIPRSDIRLVRMRDGLLVLRLGSQGRIDAKSNREARVETWFVPLDANGDLAGVLIDRDLSLLVRSDGKDGDTLTHCRFSLPTTHTPNLLFRRQKQATTAHLFRKLSAHALPTLVMVDGVEFYSASGQPFRLRFDRANRANPTSEFGPVHRAPRLMLATGAHQVVRTERDGKPVLRVRRESGSVIDDYAIPDDFPDRPRGLVYSASDRSLAYCLRPGVWTVPPVATTRDIAGRDIMLAPGELLLMGKWQGEGVSARIWSDARHGGNGTVRLVRREDGAEFSGRRPPIRLGDDSLSIGRVQFADDGAWAVALDADGWPSTLLHYRLKKRSHSYDCHRYDLDALCKDAATIDVAKFHD
jgi:hypothetical protein